MGFRSSGNFTGIFIFYGIDELPNFSNTSDRMTHPAPPIMRERLSLPPGTSSGNFTDGDELEYRSDQAIAAGRIPNNTNTNKHMKHNNSN